MGYRLCLCMFVKMHWAVGLTWMGSNDLKCTSISPTLQSTTKEILPMKYFT